jgi:hypothetical protein
MRLEVDRKGMSQQHSTASGAPESSDAGEHVAAGHGDDHGHDEHGDGETALGPIDVAAWGAGLLGIGVALAMTVAFVVATSGLG